MAKEGPVKVFLLAGQSNMQGVAKIRELPPPLAAVGMFSMTDRWGLGQEPLHPLLESLDEAHYYGWELLAQEGVTREEWLPSWRQQARAPDAVGAGPGLPVVGDNVDVGSTSLIAGPIRIGDDVKIGPGCVVTRDTPRGTVLELDLPRRFQRTGQKP